MHGKQAAESDEPHSFQARMPVLADDDVVMHGNAKRVCDLDDRLRHLDVGLRWRKADYGQGMLGLAFPSACQSNVFWQV